MKRRHFIQATTGTVAGLSLAGPAFASSPKEHTPLGVDAYSLRGYRWKAHRLIDYCAEIKVDAIQFNLPDLESRDDEYIKSLKEHADRVGIAIEGSLHTICPLSDQWNPSWGPVRDYMLMGIRLAKGMGAKSIKTYLGVSSDREGDIPLEAKIEKTIESLKSVRSETLDAGVKFALETHGDLLARELKMIIEEAGPDIAACCLDTGNPVRHCEDPFMALELLGPYTITTHIRDNVIYEHPRGAAYQGVALGDGSIDFKRFVDRYREICPQAPFLLETLTGGRPRVLPYLEPEFWTIYPDMPAADFARFLRHVREGHPFRGSMMIGFGDDQPPAYEAALLEQQRFDLERGIEYAKKELDLGINWRKEA